MECSSRPTRGEIASALTPPHQRRITPVDIGEGKRASLGGGAPRRRHAPPPIAAGHHDTRKRPVQSGGELPKSGSLHPALGRDKKDRELYPWGFLGSLEVVPCFWSAGLSCSLVIVRGWPGRSEDPGCARWILVCGFESHCSGLCWSARAGDPRSLPWTPSSTSADQ